MELFTKWTCLVFLVLNVVLVSATSEHPFSVNGKILQAPKRSQRPPPVLNNVFLKTDEEYEYEYTDGEVVTVGIVGDTPVRCWFGTKVVGPLKRIIVLRKIKLLLDETNCITSLTCNLQPNEMTHAATIRFVRKKINCSSGLGQTNSIRGAAICDESGRRQASKFSVTWLFEIEFFCNFISYGNCKINNKPLTDEDNCLATCLSSQSEGGVKVRHYQEERVTCAYIRALQCNGQNVYTKSLADCKAHCDPEKYGKKLLKASQFILLVSTTSKLTEKPHIGNKTVFGDIVQLFTPHENDSLPNNKIQPENIDQTSNRQNGGQITNMIITQLEIPPKNKSEEALLVNNIPPKSALPKRTHDGGGISTLDDQRDMLSQKLSSTEISPSITQNMNISNYDQDERNIANENTNITSIVVLVVVSITIICVLIIVCIAVRRWYKKKPANTIDTGDEHVYDEPYSHICGARDHALLQLKQKEERQHSLLYDTAYEHTVFRLGKPSPQLY